MLIPLAAGLALISVIAMLYSPLWGIVITLASKPVVDTTWGYGIGGIKLLYIISAAIPALILPRLHGLELRSRRNRSLELTALVYLLSQVLGTHGLLLEGDYWAFTEAWTRSLNGYVGFFLFAYYFQERRAFRILLLTLIIAGIFPVVTGVYQNVTGIAWREATTVGLVRKIGLYHDAVSFRFYGFQAIVATILLWGCFRPLRRIVTAMLLSYVAMWVYVIHNIYSKAAVIIVAVWLVTWPVLTRRYGYLTIGLVLGIVLIASPFAEGLIGDLEQLFSKEIAFGAGEGESQRMLAGRGYIWEDFLDDWGGAPAVTKLAGDGRMAPVHNEFLRVLKMNGIVGLCFFVGVLVRVAWALTHLAIRSRSPLHIMALMVFQMYLVDCMGLHPGWYPSYQVFVWGIIGLSLDSASFSRLMVCRPTWVRETPAPLNSRAWPPATREGGRTISP